MNHVQIKVNSSQFNYTYGNRIHLPYSIALLVSYIKTKEKFSQFKFEKTFVFRREEKIEEYVEKCRDLDILLCSCYVWNWEITTLLAKKVKEINPKCLIIFGGPQVPEILEDFFDKYPFVDIAVHGEGEIIFENILSEYLKSFVLLGYDTKGESVVVIAGKTPQDYDSIETLLRRVGNIDFFDTAMEEKPKSDNNE